MPESSDPFFTKASPANSPSILIKNGCRLGSLQYSVRDL
jgi:hypothetical protein